MNIITDFSKMLRRKYKYYVCVLVFVYVFYLIGLGDYMLARSYERDFDYPLSIDIRPLVEDVLAGKKSSVSPINYYPYRFLSNSGKCTTLEKLDLFIVIKSAMSNVGHRMAIRKTYSREHVQGKVVKSLFFLGTDPSRPDTQKKIDEEMAEHKDIIQVDFHDSYFNNTIKTMISFRWLYEHCSTADFYLFTDDDMYISVRNLLAYVDDTKSPTKHTEVKRKDRDLLAGYVFKSAPQRFRSSKWRVSLSEYPWNMWPPYVTAGAYVVSNKTMKKLYVASLFVKHFRFDDIYIGILAKKLSIEPTHCDRFHYYKKKYSKEGYKDVIASHGFHEHKELIQVWNEQNM